MNRVLFFLFISFIAASGCAAPRRNRRAAPSKPAATQPAVMAPAALTPKASDLVNQKALYEDGLRYYSQQKYIDAKKSWEQALVISSTTELAQNIQECIRKTGQVLKTLQEIETKNDKQGTGLPKPSQQQAQENSPIQKSRPAQESISR